MGRLTDLIALSLAPAGFGCVVAESLRRGAAPDSVLGLIFGAEPLLADTLRPWAATAERDAAERGIGLIGWDDPAYPPALAAIADAPPVLWTHGTGAGLERPAVAIVGSRAATPYAIQVAERLGSDLAAAGIVVVSGLARGVDAAAHRGALAGGGTTVAVLGCGADIVYPAEHRGLTGEIAATGTVVTEFPPGSAPEPWHFPRRNRIISGLSRAVVVVEAGERSGSLITARAALEQGRDVLAVPGNVLTGRNRGTHALLRDGAKIVEDVTDILEELGLGPGAPAAASRQGRGDRLLACLPVGEPLGLDEISERSGLLTPKLLPRLFELELLGLVRRAGGGRFVRFDRPC